MDKKAKKRIKALRGKIEKLRHVLAGARQQQDEPDEVERVQQEIADCEAQIKVFQNG